MTTTIKKIQRLQRQRLLVSIKSDKNVAVYAGGHISFRKCDFYGFILSTKAEGESSPLFQRAYFKVGDINDYDKVKEEIKKVDIQWEQYDLIDNNGNSETMSSNFNDLGKSAM